jgi:endo-1,4-beta-xylanase
LQYNFHGELKDLPDSVHSGFLLPKSLYEQEIASMNTHTSLCNTYKQHFPIGAAITHADMLTTQYNSITAENCMKFALTHPKQDRYTFEDSDKLSEFARKNGIKMRGHTLVWHGQTPDWVFVDAKGDAVSRDTLLERMHEHIQTVVGRYRESVYCWDVVNEAAADDGDNILRKTKWLDIIGEDYLLKAFQFAHEADPNAVLFYNDYNETDPNKLKKITALLKKLLDLGAPIHGMGMQAHYGPTKPPIEDIRRAIDSYASLGLQVQITEMDISVYEWDAGPSSLTFPSSEMMENQAQRYEQIFSLLREYHDVITGVTLWGAADDTTWLDHFPVPNRKNWPLLFDEDHQPKEACMRIMNF